MARTLGWAAHTSCGYTDWCVTPLSFFSVFLFVYRRGSGRAIPRETALSYPARPRDVPRRAERAATRADGRRAREPQCGESRADAAEQKQVYCCGERSEWAGERRPPRRAARRTAHGTRAIPAGTPTVMYDQCTTSYVTNTWHQVRLRASASQLSAFSSHHGSYNRPISMTFKPPLWIS